MMQPWPEFQPGKISTRMAGGTCSQGHIMILALHSIPFLLYPVWGLLLGHVLSMLGLSSMWGSCPCQRCECARPSSPKYLSCELQASLMFYGCTLANLGRVKKSVFLDELCISVNTVFTFHNRKHCVNAHCSIVWGDRRAYGPILWGDVLPAPTRPTFRPTYHPG